MKRGGPYKFQRVWAFPSGVITFIKQHAKGHTLHACCGESEFGDVKIDKYVERADIINMDIIQKHLPKNYHNLFDTVICDPPWNLPYHLRPRLHYNLRDALKTGGKLIFNALWVPKARGLEIQELWLRIPKAFTRNCSIWTISIKNQHQLNEY